MPKNLSQIIALGGGGFSDEPDNTSLDEYILRQDGNPKPKICFLPTAGGDPDEYIQKFYKIYDKLNSEPSHLALTKTALTHDKIGNLLLSQDIIFIGGGSTKFLVNTLRKCGVDKILKQAWEKGVVLSGISAGAMYMFTKNFTNPRDDVFEPLGCLGLLKGSFCPHYDSANGLKEIFSRMILNKEIPSGYGVEDGVALHFIGKKLYKVVSSRPGAGAYFVKKNLKAVKVEKVDINNL